MDIRWCTYTSDMGFCGLQATHGDRCLRHVGKEIKIKATKSPRFRGDSQWQVEQGLGFSKTGSHA